MSMRRESRGFRSPNRGLWTLLVVMLVVLAVSCCGGLLVATAQHGGDGDPATSDSPPARGSAGSAPAAAPRRLTVPNLVGARLPDAARQLESLGFGSPRLEDATGRKRPVLARENWVVRGQTPAPGAVVAASAKVTLRVSKPTDAAATDPPAEGVIPNVVCRDLQAAQDALQAAGFFVLASVDGSGKGRRQLIDRNWVVTEQSVAPGSRPVRSTRVLLTVVKIGEGGGSCAS